MRISVQGKQEYIPDKIEELFLKEWMTNKHNINLVREDYVLALFYYNVGYSVGFHEGFNTQKSTKPSKKKGHN